MSRQRNTPEMAQLTGQLERNPKRYKGRGSSALCVKITAVKPKFKNEETSHAWETIVPPLEALKVLTIQDLPSLDELFRTYEYYINSCKLLDKFSKEWEESGQEISKEFIDMRKSLILQVSTTQNDFNKLASRFGLTPVDRTRLYFQEEQEANPIDELLQTVNG